MESGILKGDVDSDVNPNLVPDSRTTQEIQSEVPCSDNPSNADSVDTSDTKGDGKDESTARINTQCPVNMDSNVEIEGIASCTVGEKSEIQSNTCMPSDNSPQESTELENKIDLEDNQINVSVHESGADERNDSETQVSGATQSLYHIKWFTWKGLNTALIMQNENGPCPLLAIINLLILSRKISIPPMQEFITAGQLMEYLGDCILEHAPKRLSEGAQLNYEQNMHDAIGIMNKLQTGLDVNVKFTGVADFEFTPECIVFDLLNVGLYHGWLVDPQDSEETRAVGKLSYNQLVEKIIATKQQPDSQLVSEGLIAESFLERTASQLTYHGLCELNAQLKDDELCVFFRNNHFSTLYKHRHELFLLVTDQGFLTEEQVIWETLSNVEGDCVFVDANFRTSPASRAPASAPAPAPARPPPPQPQPSTSTAVEPMAGISQEDQDFLVALSLQEEQNQSSQRSDGIKPNTNTETVSTEPAEQADPQAYQEWTDLQLAMQLQEEEQRVQQQQARMAQRRQENPQPTLQGLNSGRPVQRTPQAAQETQQKSNGDKCLIL